MPLNTPGGSNLIFGHRQVPFAYELKKIAKTLKIIRYYTDK